MATSPLVNIDALNTVYEAICNQFKEKVYTTTANPSEILGTSSAHYSQAYIDTITAKSWSISSAGAASFNSTLHASGAGTIGGGLTVTGNTTINSGSLNVNSTSSASIFSGTLSVTNDFTAKRHFTLGTTSSTGVDSMRWYDAIIDERELPDAFKADEPSEAQLKEIQNYKAKDNKITSAKWVEAYAGARLSVLENDISEDIKPDIEDLNRSVFGTEDPNEATANSGKIINASTQDASANSTNAAIYTPGGLKVGLNIYADAVHNAVWNDLVDCIPVPEDTELEYGYCYKFDGENYTKTSNYSDSQFMGIHSDTAGFYMGERPTKTLKASVAGFVLAHVDRVYKPGTLLTCTKDGELTKANLFIRVFKSHSIIASFWKDETEEEWGPSSRKIKVNGRKWVKVF